ncbi:MAG: hypothetical protein AAFP19_00320 [Bacteroidota bacterium]
MKNSRLIIYWMMCCLMIQACTGENSANHTNTPDAPSTDQPNDNQEEVVPSASADDKIIPGHRIGLIQADATEADIIKAYGDANVERADIGVGEGEIVPGTKVFPGTEKELLIEWQPKQAYQKMARIRVERANAPWVTLSGVRIGTSLGELQKINGKDFDFYGFEWDYSGLVNDWKEGELSKNLQVFLTPVNMEAIFPDLLGDSSFPCDHPKAKEAGLEVSALVLLFDQ